MRHVWFLAVASQQLSLALRLPSRSIRRAPPPLCLATGDRVKVTKDVAAKGVATTLGMRGTVLDAWEQDAENWGSCCELDPACCASVTVKLDPPLGYFEPNELERLDRSRKGDLVEGEEVRVCRDVSAKGIPNALGMTGTVTDVWTGCEVDPACCCNELATAPITVSLRPEGAAADADWLAYFAEDELEVIRPPAVVASGAINWAERTM